MGLINDVDLEAAADRGEERPLTEITRVVDTAVAGRVNFYDVNAARTIAGQIPARAAFAAGDSARTLLAIEGSCQNPSRGGLAAPSRPGEQVSMIDPIVGQRSLQWLCDVILTDDISESIGTVPPVESKRGVCGRVAARFTEQRLVLGVLDPVRLRLREPRLIQARFVHPCTLCLDADSLGRFQPMRWCIEPLGACDRRRP